MVYWFICLPLLHGSNDAAAKTKAMKSIATLSAVVIAIMLLVSCSATRDTTEHNVVFVSKVLHRINDSMVLTKGNYDHFKRRAEIRTRKASALQLTAARGTGGMVLDK